MLATTVSYLSLLESKRHNIATEGIQRQQVDIDQQRVNIQAGQLEETKRHNVATESISWGNLAELERHNRVVESTNMFDANTRRAQLEINQYEADTHRYAAVQNAGIGWANVAVNQGQLEVSRTRTANDFVIGSRNANAALAQAKTAENRLQEDIRWHDVTAVQKQEDIALRQEQLDWDKNIEQQRVNVQRADMIWSNVLDTIDTAGKLYDSVTDSLPTSKYIKKGKKK